MRFCTVSRTRSPGFSACVSMMGFQANAHTAKKGGPAPRYQVVRLDGEEPAWDEISHHSRYAMRYELLSKRRATQENGRLLPKPVSTRRRTPDGTRRPPSTPTRWVRRCPSGVGCLLP